MAMGEVRTEPDGVSPGLPVVTVSGEVDLAVAPVMEAHITNALGPGSDLVIDLSGATFIDSVALGVLTLTLERCEDAGNQLFLVIGDQRVLRVFELTGLTTSFSIFDSREALSSHISQTGAPS